MRRHDDSQAGDQALQQFVNQSPWDHRSVLHRLRQQMRSRAQAGGVFVLDEPSLPKQGRHSVGVTRQYCGTLGKITNCQSIVTWHWMGTTGLHWLRNSTFPRSGPTMGRVGGRRPRDASKKSGASRSRCSTR